MKKPMLSLIVLFTWIFYSYGQIPCSIDGPLIVCNEERVTIEFDADVPEFTEIIIDAFTVVNGTQVLAIQENVTNTTADIIFLSGGDAEIVIRYINGTQTVAVCNKNVFVFDETPIPALNQFSTIVGDQVVCGSLDLEISTFFACPDCPFFWTLDEEAIELDQQVSTLGNLKSVLANLNIDELGSYTFCLNIAKPDTSCIVEDCITIDIVELDITPEFSVDETASNFCLGSTLIFENATLIDEEVLYFWEVKYDSLTWRYSTENLEFDFTFPGEYIISLQYVLSSNESCVSDKYSSTITISDDVIFPILCNANTCTESIITYQAPIECGNYFWEFDLELGTLISEEENTITIQWNNVEHYTETQLKLTLENCSEDACEVSFRNIQLYPEELIIEGPSGICDRGEEWFEADLIPNAVYTWEIELVDSVSGISPAIIKIEDNRALVAFYSYAGSSILQANASIPSQECTISGEISTLSLLVNSNDNLCPGDLFKASVSPKIDQDIVWTLTNDTGTYFKQETVSGQSNFFAFDLVQGGDYMLSATIPELEFSCNEEIPLTVLDNPAITLVGPQFVCPGEPVTYTLEGLGGNDAVEWTVFQNNSSMQFTGNEITVTWLEGGEPYSIKVSRSTEVFPGQICDSASQSFPIGVIQSQELEITGPEVLCYDAIDTFFVIDNPGMYHWEINPSYMGTIVDGDSTDQVVVQWHYAPDISTATLSTSREICGETFTADIDISFEQFQAVLVAPDSVCLRENASVFIQDLTSYQTIEFYVDDVLVNDDQLEFNYTFTDTGYVTVKIVIAKPNNCPDFLEIEKTVYVVPDKIFDLNTSMSIIQCPKEEFEDVLVEVSYQDPTAYYEWAIDTEIIKAGFGSTDLYNYLITRELILSGALQLILTITYPSGCDYRKSIQLDYPCGEPIPICVCIEPIDIQIDVTPLECNLVSYSAEATLNTLVDPIWVITTSDTIITMPINGEEDLELDSFYFPEGSTLSNIAISAFCEGILVLEDEIIDSVLCDDVYEGELNKLYFPEIEEEYVCNDDLTYDVHLTEESLVNIMPPYNTNLFWIINGTAYEGVNIVVENVVGGTLIDIQLTQCNLDGSYCCTNNFELEVIETFSPEIILPNGSCENDLWLFTIDQPPSEIVSTLWNFGDGSGSTLFITEKGFLDTLSHDISVEVANDIGCIATSEITVQSFPNNIEGQIVFESDPCAPVVDLIYDELSESTIITYEWNITGAPDSSLVQITKSGDYKVTVTDINGCTNVASVNDIKVNESFKGGMRFNPENCGTAIASVAANPEYMYEWYVNGILLNSSNSIQINSAGFYELKVISTSINSGEICDSLIENLTIFPLPTKPIILEEKLFCAPFIFELSLENYDMATWSINNNYTEESASIQVSENGIYRAIVEDDNGCTSSSTIGINESVAPFDLLLNQCIEACRDELDSLQIFIPGIDYVANSWTWISVDSLGVEYEIELSSGMITPLLLTENMYDYVQLQITDEECILRSDIIPLDITNCDEPDEVDPPEITCEEIDSDHDNCGLTIYKCLLSEENGGPKLYFEGMVTVPMDATLCNPDSLTVSLNNGEIVITDLVLEEVDGKLMAFYSANLIISDATDFETNGTVIQFDFCNPEGDISYCYEYALPYRTCNKDFECLIDYQGISSGGQETVFINYCLNLSEVVQDNCVLSNYEVEAFISGDIQFKKVYSQILVDDFNMVTCISIPVSQSDFFGGDYNCIELMVKGNCPGIQCSEYQCGIFGNGNLVSADNQGNHPITNMTIENQEIGESKNRKGEQLNIYPNPSTSVFNFDFNHTVRDGTLVIKDVEGRTVQHLPINNVNTIALNMDDSLAGLYFATLISGGELITTKKMILIR
ncbi:MAG: T9SS type A sorting domain-containing protein [Saprospiraceae bacterium]|nr:T9SS type A sorting domain-containing protein [Saprospiraceae bacterium]